jgi:putative hydrolase of the HAD superfamily
MTQARAILFDLDETLYPERRFLLSGYAAVAAEVERSTAVPASAVFTHLTRAIRAGRRGEAFQEVCARFAVDHALVPRLLSVYRQHQPRLRLPRAARETLQRMRGSWRIAVVTNGLPDVQQRKVAALGLEGLVDAVILAHACGSGEGKPAPDAFVEALHRLDVCPWQAVMVGDDPVCDIDGARALGIRTIRLRQGVHRRAGAGCRWDADAVVDSLGAVPTLAARLLQEGTEHAA